MDKQIAKNEGAMVDLLNQEMKELQGSQKQIEEFACDLYNAWCGDIVIGDKYKWVAKKLMALGYRKIPEGAVVLTREAYGSLKELEFDCREEYLSGYEDGKVKARKETAEKFSERLKAKLNEWLEDNEDNDGKIDFGIAEIELIGVKSLEGEVIAESLIDEIAKEITEGSNG